jgi:AcrR family transcriptional regulator
MRAMQTPARILRARALERDRIPRFLNPKQRDRHERILSLSQYIFLTEGFQTISFRSLAIALRMATSTLRYHFADLDALLGELLRRHLRNLAAELAKISHDVPNRQRACRAAYLAFTRVGAGSLSEPHHLLVEYAHLLPLDERQIIDRMRDGLADTLAGNLGHEALLLLDSPLMNGRLIEAALAAMDDATNAAAPPVSPEPPQPEAPPAKVQSPPPNRPYQPRHLPCRTAGLDKGVSAMVLALARSGTPRVPPAPD